jgi:hypothetical protein
MKFRIVLLVLFFVSSVSFSQTRVQGYDDGQAAQQYVNWAKKEIDEGRWSSALAGLERAADFANVSSDISYQLALARSHEDKNRTGIIEVLDHAVDVNRWVIYNKNDALLLKAQQLVAMRKFSNAISILDGTVTNADSVCLRLMALKGQASGIGDSTNDAPQLFRTLLLSALDRFPRDPRPLRIFFEYARNRMPEPSRMPQSDLNLLDLALRRLPFLMEIDAELAWMAAPFIKDTEEARRLMSTYRVGALSGVQSRDFRPSPESIPVALNLGLIDDITAVEELFSGTRGINSPLPARLKVNGDPVIDLETLNKVYGLLRSEIGRDLFTQNLLVFSGCIISDDDKDGNIDNITYYRSGIISEFVFDLDQDNTSEIQIVFSAGIPVSAEYMLTGQKERAQINWERYPSVEKAVFAGESFSFRPADFQFQPVSFIVLGGSSLHAGLPYPVLTYKLDLTRRTFVSFCASITRSSAEFNRALECIFFVRGFPVQAVEILNGKYISFTEFERGIPVIQYLDMDADGRMETIRRFHRPSLNNPWPDEEYNYLKLIASSDSDWTGEGRYKTGEVYLQDGAVVYLWDMDGSGVMDYSRVENQ